MRRPRVGEQRLLAVRLMMSDGRDLRVVHLALLQELLRVEGVERAQVMDHGHQFREDGGVLGVLRQEDAAQDHLQLVLHFLYELGIP